MGLRWLGLYRRTVSLPYEICRRSALYESKRTKFFFNGTICTLVKDKHIELVILCMAQYLVIILWSDSTVFHFVNGFLMIHLILLASLPCLYILLVVFRDSLYNNIADVSCWIFTASSANFILYRIEVGMVNHILDLLVDMDYEKIKACW